MRPPRITRHAVWLEEYSFSTPRLNKAIAAVPTVDTPSNMCTTMIDFATDVAHPQKQEQNAEILQQDPFGAGAAILSDLACDEYCVVVTDCGSNGSM